MSTSNTPTTPIATTHAPLTDETKIQATQVTSMEMSSMESRQLHSSQQEAMKKIPEFSGEPNEFDINEWLFDLTNLFTKMKLEDETKIFETMAKLAGPALRWYQENLGSFTNWEDAQKGLRDRFKEFKSYNQLMQEFFQIYQEENQSVTSFYEYVMRKYRKAKEFITEQQVITVLQVGVKHSLHEYLIRNEQNITKPEEWLQLAREEEHIQKRIQQQYQNFCPDEADAPFFESALPTATIQSRSLNKQVSGQRTVTSRQHYQKQQHKPSLLTNNPIYQK